ncbi:MAG: flagellar basal body rod protein FlgB [Hyphomonadaceae bacterium]|nr:flagellar basal body rod protein FlgB [Clostridia bacterium]
MLQKGLDVAWTRNRVIANNIANAETPNFKASKVEFESILKSELGGGGSMAMRKSSDKHMNSGGGVGSSIEPSVIQNQTTSMRTDGNNVDIENEMTELAKNNLLYQTLVQKASKEMAKARYIISEGRG